MKRKESRMINAPTYETYKRLRRAMEYIFSGAIDGLDCGRHDLEDGIYVNVSEIGLKDDGVFESHHKYIDIHYPLTGCEKIIVAAEEELKVTKEYDEDADYMLGTSDGGESFTVRPKQPFVVMPGEAHVPCLRADENTKIKKAVVKILA